MKKEYIPAIFLLLFPILLFVLIGIFLFQRHDSSLSGSTLNLNASDTPKTTTEPTTTSAQIYNNDEFNFQLSIPDTWSSQDYPNPNGGTLIAFSPDELPCKNCTYFHNGFFSIRIYTQKSDPVLYSSFTQRTKNLGQSNEYRQVTIGGKSWILYANTVAVENQGWVYDISLDTNEGNTKIIDSQLMQQILLSFSFTGIQIKN